MPHKNRAVLVRKQHGATLMTTLIFLILMTLLAIFSMESTLLDSLLARNNKERILIYQDTANDLKLLATVQVLHDPMLNNKFDQQNGTYNSPVTQDKNGSSQVITDIGFDEDNPLYDCEGYNGRASAIGLGSRKCDLFDFSVDMRLGNRGGVTEKHHVGKGKEVPSPSKYSNL